MLNNEVPLIEYGMAFFERRIFFHPLKKKNLLDYLLCREMSKTVPKILPQHKLC